MIALVILKHFPGKKRPLFQCCTLLFQKIRLGGGLYIYLFVLKWKVKIFTNNLKLLIKTNP